MEEQFPHLSKAPIVEAALEVRVVPITKWDENALTHELKSRLTDYPNAEPLRLAKFEVKRDRPAEPRVEDFGCVGLKLPSANKLHIAQFNKESFVFSRLRPYEDWDQFRGEALRLWKVYCELLNPCQITRIGLRFINRIAIRGDSVQLGDYYRYPPTSPKELDWPLAGYLHHEVMQVPETEFSVNVIKTVQNAHGETGLILDIDVFWQDPKNQSKYSEVFLLESLESMRWVKNKVFFSSLTDTAVENLK